MLISLNRERKIRRRSKRVGVLDVAERRESSEGSPAGINLVIVRVVDYRWGIEDALQGSKIVALIRDDVREVHRSFVSLHLTERARKRARVLKTRKSLHKGALSIVRLAKVSRLIECCMRSQPNRIRPHGEPKIVLPIRCI